MVNRKINNKSRLICGLVDTDEDVPDIFSQHRNYKIYFKGKLSLEFLIVINLYKHIKNTIQNTNDS